MSWLCNDAPDAPPRAPAARACSVRLPPGAAADADFYLVVCADKYDNHVFIGLRSRSAPERRFYAHYGLGSKHICAFADEWHDGFDRVRFDVEIARQPAGTTFDDLVARIKEMMREFLDNPPTLPLPANWRMSDLEAHMDRSHTKGGYDLMHFNCRTFACWLCTQFGVSIDAIVEAFECIGIAWGIPGHCSVVDAVNEIDAVGALVGAYPEGITLNYLLPSAAAAAVA